MRTGDLSGDSGRDISDFLYGRALMYGKSANWSGWFCQRCSWSKPLPADGAEREALEREIKRLFDEHACDDYQLKHW